MTNVNTNAAITTDDILDITPSSGNLLLEIDGAMHYVVGADQARNVIFVDPNKDVCTPDTIEVCLDDFSSLEEVKNCYPYGYGYYRLVRKDHEGAVLKNCTPHSLNVLVGEEVIDLAPTGIVPRCSQSEVTAGEVAGIPVTRQVFGEVIDLPEPEEGVFFVVSRMVAAACPERKDLLIPGPLVRDDEGRVVGCRGLSRL